MQNIATIHVDSSGFISWNVANLREGMMQSRLWISSVLLVLSLSVQTATAGPQEDVAAAGQKWATVFAENNPDAAPLCQRRRAVGHAVTDDTVGRCRRESLLRRRLPSVAEGHRQVR